MDNNEELKTDENSISSIDYAEWKLEKRRRLYIAFIAASALIAVGILLYYVVVLNPSLNMERYNYSDRYAAELRRNVGLWALVFFGIAGAGIVMFYLQTGFRKINKKNAELYSYQSEIEKLRSSFVEAGKVEKAKLELIEKKVNDLGTISSQNVSDILTDEQKASIADSIKTQLQSESANVIIEEFEERYRSESEKKLALRELFDQFSQTRERLSKEVSSLGWRGNLNLTLGILISIVGVSTLWSFINSINYNPEKLNSYISFAGYFVPRLSLVILIELFAYFFLNLYRSSLSEIKYFQNELTNVEMKYVALTMALSVESNKVYDPIALSFASTERNFILNKGQSTIELEKAKIEKELLTEIASKFSDIFHKSKK